VFDVHGQCFSIQQFPFSILRLCYLLIFLSLKMIQLFVINSHYGRWLLTLSGFIYGVGLGFLLNFFSALTGATLCFSLS
jgi:uncharacterized membrane protein YdjX (TVP38/TMEM64 family)